MKCPNAFLYPSLPEVSPCLLFQKESGIIIFHPRFTSITGQVPRRPPRGLLLNRRPAQPRGGLRAPLGSASPGSPGVTRVSLPPASLRPPHSPPTPESRGRPRTAAVQTGERAPSGFPGSSPGYLGAEPRRGLSPQAPSFLVSALLPELPLPPRTPVPASAGPPPTAQPSCIWPRGAKASDSHGRVLTANQN